ncbi:MAG: SDR family NAD(P)-dependent oxidoreductase [Rhodoferax sp.]|nr:SDR family NAD(P)-dependent oxidoreductase [Rhodoferax sp.]
MSMRPIQGKSVVITGAASGIGEALALAFAKRGAKLLLADIDAAGLSRVQRAVQALGAHCHIQVTDTGSEDAIKLLAACAQSTGAGADIVINNAGVSVVSPVAKLQMTDAHWLMNINFWGVVQGCRAFIPMLRGKPDTVLVNVSSIFAMISVPTQSIYNASKAAVRAFSDALREELRSDGIDVLCVHPGGIQTNIANKARITDVSMVADTDQEMRDNFTKLARTTPAQAAAVIIEAIESRKTRVLIGADAKLMDMVFRLIPTRASRWFTNLGQRMRERAKRQAATSH